MPWLLVVLSLLLVPAAPPAHGLAADRLAQAEQVQPLNAVLKTIGQRFPGRALDAKRVDRQGRPAYRIKWLGEDGKVRDVVADARTGKILRVR